MHVPTLLPYMVVDALNLPDYPADESYSGNIVQHNNVGFVFRAARQQNKAKQDLI